VNGGNSFTENPKVKTTRVFSPQAPATSLSMSNPATAIGSKPTGVSTEKRPPTLSGHYVSEWWKQLYGESEGKDNKGIFPASVDFSTDLHC